MSIYSKDYNDIFLTKYKELEGVQSNEPRQYQFLLNKHRNEMDTFRYMRNTLSHNLINGKPPFIVSKDVIDLITKYLNDVKKKVYSFSVKTDKMIFVNYTDTLKELLSLMGENNYSYIPVVDNEQKVVGIASSDSIIDIFNEREKLNVKEEDKLYKYSSYFSIENNENGFYLFIDRNMYLFELEDLVERYQNTTHKLGIILITKHGNKNERILGLLTPWDIIKNQ